MPTKSDNANQPESGSHTIPPSAVCSEQWWRATEYDSFPLSDAGGNASRQTLLNHPMEVAGSKDDQAVSNARDDDDDDDETSKDSETTGSTSTHRVGSSGLEGQKSQFGASNLALGTGDCLTQHPLLELAGHSMACASTGYPDLYYGGMMSPYGPGPQSLVPPPFYGMHQPRMPLPLEMAQEPVYVNAKQYHGILRRRQVRAKAELERKLIKVRKPYLHESRHQHALRRARGSGGRFAKKGEAEAYSHSGGEEKHSTEDAGGSRSREDHGEHIGMSNGSVDTRAAEGQSNQQWGSMLSDQAPQRALAMR